MVRGEASHFVLDFDSQNRSRPAVLSNIVFCGCLDGGMVVFQGLDRNFYVRWHVDLLGNFEFKRLLVWNQGIKSVSVSITKLGLRQLVIQLFVHIAYCKIRLL